MPVLIYITIYYSNKPITLFASDPLRVNLTVLINAEKELTIHSLLGGDSAWWDLITPGHVNNTEIGSQAARPRTV